MNLTFASLFRLFCLLVILLPISSKANMASPWIEGTQASTVFSSRQLDILSESIKVNLEKDFRTARFDITYLIRSDEDGVEIPLLFHALDYLDSFLVFLDGKPVYLQSIPDSLRVLEGSPYEGFSNSFTRFRPENRDETNMKWWNVSSSLVYRLSDFKYFRTLLGKGEHEIRVFYRAKQWLNVGGWMEERSFRYSLSPAKYWRSFGTLKIEIKKADASQHILCNLGKASSVSADSLLMGWQFDSLPSEVFSIALLKPMPAAASRFIAIPSYVFSVFVGLLIVLLQLWLYRYLLRKAKKIFVIIFQILSCLIVPFLIVCFGGFYYDIAKYLIGEDAGRIYSYGYSDIFLYPVLVIADACLLIGMHKRYKGLNHQSTSKI